MRSVPSLVLPRPRHTEEEMGRQHQGMDRPGVRQVSEGQWRTGKNGENWLQYRLWCPNDLRCKGLDDDDYDDVPSLQKVRWCYP